MKFFKKIKDLFEKQNTLYYPGCITKFVYKKLYENYKKLLNKAGVDFIELKELEKCCGSPVINAGYRKDYNDLINHNRKVFQEAGVKKVVTNCPACYKTLKEAYPDLIIEHASVTLFNALNKKKIRFRELKNEKVTYHDPCHLGRHSGVYEEPRALIKAIGYKIEEMNDNREDSLCCGAGAGMQNNTPKVANKVANLRLKQASNTSVKKLITACPMCYHHLKKHAKNIEVIELSEVLVNGIK